MFNICRNTNLFERMIVRIPPFSLLYCSFYRKTVEEEAIFANIDSDDRLLFIGGGAIPYSALILAKKAKHVTVIDCDSISAKLASCLIQRLGISNVTVKCDQGEQLNPEEHSVIFIPLQAEPKQRILENIKSKCNLKTKVLMRIPKKSFSNVYTTLESVKLKSYKEKKVKQLTYDKVVMFHPEDIEYVS